MRKGASSGSVFGSTCSKYSSSVGPEYQGISAERATTLAPVSAATGDRGDLGEAEIAGQRPEVCLDGTVALFRPVDLVHLVDGDDDLLDADEIADRRVAARLALHAVARIDQENGEIGVRGARRHVAGVLLVARRIDDDEAAACGLEIAARRCQW